LKNNHHSRRITTWSFAGIGVLGLFTVCFVGVGSTGAAASSGGLPKTITIGILATVTGPDGGPDGCQSSQFSDELAASTSNAEHYLGKGITIKTVTEDDQGTQAGATIGFQKLVSQHVVGLEGLCLTENADTIAPEIDSAKLPTVFSGVTDPSLFKHTYGFQGDPPQESYDGNTIKALAAAGVKTVSVIYTNDEYDTNAVWNQSWKPEMKKLGIKVLGVFPVTQSATNISPEIAQIQQEKPQAIGVDTYVSSAIGNVLELRSSGVTQPLFGQILFAYGFFQNTAGTTTDGGDYYATDFAPTVYGPAESFAKVFQAKYAVAPNPGAAQEYDGAWRLIRAIKSANSVNPAAIQRALAAQKTYTGVEGKITYGNSGHTAASQGYVFLVKNGKLAYQNVAKK
jgi:branched-chain amino acid transport system substrate-binding protein